MTDPTPAFWGRVRDAFDAVADLPEAERAAALDAACRTPDGAPDAALRAEVETLLAADAAASGLDAPAADRAAGLVDDAEAGPDRTGERVGPWAIEREIGRGGMGAVYLVARADGAFEQTAALKRVSLGGPGRTRRFVQERQILAGLDHEGIARLIDGGVADDGTPYLVMEYVEGEPITAYCDARRLGVEDRVRLFADVCDAVGHAHRHLVVHRDLKPSNVFVSDGEDGRPRVKLLDFGIAKLLDDAPEAAHTRTGLPHLTPEYAAPEQVTDAPVTTATDVYSLGVLLYELLAGRRPYAIESATLADIVDTLRTVEPGPPSVASGERALRGDLDTIALKALAKEPERRYGSADELGDDLRRHLDGLPVEARAPTPAYRIGRFVRRHRAGVAATAIGVLLLVAGASFYTVRLAAERDRATLAATRAERTADFLELIFAGSDPTGATDPGEMTARALLDAGAAQAREELAEEPVVLAQMLATIGRVYRAVGLYPEAEPALRDALALYDATDEDPLGQRDALLQLANLQYRTEAYDEAGHLARQALRLDSLHARPEQSSRLAILNTVALVHSDLGEIHEDAGELETAARLMEEVVAGRRALDTEEARVDLMANLNNLGLIYTDLDRHDEAEPIFDEAVALIEEVHGPEHPYLAFTLNSRSAVYEVRRDFARALADMARAVEIGEAALGPDHPFTAYARNNVVKLSAVRDSLGL